VKIYWDTSALLWYYGQGRIEEIVGVTRTHSLAEAFSALSGAGLHVRQADGSVRWRRFSPRLAKEVVKRLHSRLEYNDLTAAEIIAALERAQANAVQGGRVHDLLHAVAADKAGADELWTLDRNDFGGLGRAKLRNPSEDPPGKPVQTESA
jgi:predicted nucleic acid-binding protein